MSYAIRIVKDAEGVRLTDPPDVQERWPDGVWVINGHVPSPDTSPVASLSVTFVNGEGQYVGSATANFDTR